MVAKSPDQKRVVLVDANSLLHRAFHALPPLTTPKGELIGAVYGFASMLLKVIQELAPDYMAVAWDTHAPTFRHQQFNEYKGNRKETPNELVQQFDKAHQLLDAFDIPQFAMSGYEADDIIGTLANQANQHSDSLEVVVVTGDMDMLQLVNEKTRVFAPRKGFADTMLYGPDEVKERFEGLGPEQVIEYKALRGDPSDNIPGVKGVGEKTAITLLNKYQNLEGLYQHIDEVSNKQKHLLVTEQEIAFLSRKLAQIIKDAPIEMDLVRMDFRTLDPDRVKQLFQEYGFRSLVDKIPTDHAQGHENEVVGSVDFNFDDQTYTPVDEDRFDVRIAAHLLTGESGSALELPSLVFSYLGQNIGKDELTEDQRGYCLAKLKEVLEEKLAQADNRPIKWLFYELEMPLKKVIKKMEQEGILVDQKLMRGIENDLRVKIEELRRRALGEIGHEVNLNSPKQLEQLLFDELRLPVLKKTKTQRSTGEEVLVQLKGLHPVIETILEYRECSKLKSTYIDPLPNYLDENGRVHTTYNQTRVASGRLSSENPNLQNIPTNDGAGMRRMFIASPGKKLIAADYSQFELRIMAHITGDENLITAFQQDEDIHSATASRIFDKPMDRVTSEERRIGKTINFALMYGMGPHALSQSLNIDMKRAKEYIDRFLGQFPKVAEWKENHLKEVRSKGYVETLYGRRRYLSAIAGGNFHQRSFEERVAINHPLQGTQADLLKMAMLKLDLRFASDDLRDRAKMLLQVHDELVFEVDEAVVQKVMPEIKQIMEESVELKVPAKVEIGAGPNWQDAKS